MSNGSDRLDLRIDIFEKAGQQALALPTLSAPELVSAILEEFRELEYLSDTPEDYMLLAADSGTPLEKHKPLGEQLKSGGRLTLAESQAPLPAGAKRPSRHLYLREQASGKVYKIQWVPAFIGRPDKGQADNEWLAVNLASYSAGLRVSRRHVQITEENGQFFIESMSGNPTGLKGSDGNSRPVTGQKQPFHHGDVIHLEHSNIAFKVIIREV